MVVRRAVVAVAAGALPKIKMNVFSAERFVQTPVDWMGTLNWVCGGLNPTSKYQLRWELFCDRIDHYPNPGTNRLRQMIRFLPITMQQRERSRRTSLAC